MAGKGEAAGGAGGGGGSSNPKQQGQGKQKQQRPVSLKSPGGTSAFELHVMPSGARGSGLGRGPACPRLPACLYV